MIVLVLGGTRSGKSEVAERLVAALAGGAAVTYLATARVDPADDVHVARVARHRARRPSHWSTREVGRDLAAALAAEPGPVLVDSLGTWVTAHDDLAVDPDPVLAALAERAGRGAPTVLVSEEVGLSVHAPTELGRRFADALGDLNHAVAAVADRVLLVVAGRVLELGPAGDPARPPPPSPTPPC